MNKFIITMRLGGLMKKVRKLYRDSATPKNKFYHFNVLGFKFRIKTYKRVSFDRYGVFYDNMGLGLNYKRRYCKLYRS